MTSPADKYRAKLISQQDLAGLYKSGQYIHFGSWYGQPHGAMKALNKYGAHLDPFHVSIVFTNGAADFMRLPGVRITTFFNGPYERACQAARNTVFTMPTQFTDGPTLMLNGPAYDYFIVRTAPMDERGRFNFSMTASWEYAAIKSIRKHSPDTKIVIEVNPNLPNVAGVPELGNNEITIDDIDMVIEDDTPLVEFSGEEPGPIEKMIAENVERLVPDRATIQLGFGSIPMAIGHLLHERRELGIHTEMFCETFLDMIEAGAVTNKHKGLYDGASIYTFGFGGKRLHDYLRTTKDAACAPVEAINGVGELAKIKRMTSINGALLIDLRGQACAHTLGEKTYSGLGGAFEFHYGAQLSEGGHGILCLHSRTKLRDGSIACNILPEHAPRTRVTIPEHCIDWVVTEHGAARLKAMSPEQRVAALIAIAHPEDREGLEKAALAQGFRMSELKTYPKTRNAFFTTQGPLT